MEGQVLTNAPFDFEFAGKKYSVKKANLRQVMEWQRKVSELSKKEIKDGTEDLSIVSFALYVILHAADASIDENFVLDNAPGDTDLLSTLKQFGFMSQQKVAMAEVIKNSLANPQSGKTSSGQ